jgi:hypothetical protein
VRKKEGEKPNIYIYRERELRDWEGMIKKGRKKKYTYLLQNINLLLISS